MYEQPASQCRRVDHGPFRGTTSAFSGHQTLVLETTQEPLRSDLRAVTSRGERSLCPALTRVIGEELREAQTLGSELSFLVVSAPRACRARPPGDPTAAVGVCEAHSDILKPSGGSIVEHSLYGDQGRAIAEKDRSVAETLDQLSNIEAAHPQNLNAPASHDGRLGCPFDHRYPG